MGTGSAGIPQSVTGTTVCKLLKYLAQWLLDPVMYSSIFIDKYVIHSLTESVSHSWPLAQEMRWRRGRRVLYLDDIERLSKPLNVNIIAVELTKLFKVFVLFSCRISKRALIIY